MNANLHGISNDRDNTNIFNQCCYENDSGKFYYLDSAREKAETIVFLHGFTGSSRDFLNLPEPIFSNYRCLIPDLPGHGKTKLLEDANVFQTHGQITLLEQWLDANRQSKLNLFGYSMGGRLALQFAAVNPHRINSLILVSTTAGIEKETMRQRRVNTDIKLAQKILNSEPEDFLTTWLSQHIFQGIAERGQEFIAAEVARRLPIQPAGLACSLKYFSTGVMPSVWHQLPHIKIPTLVIAGSRDRKYLAIANELVASMPNASLTILNTTHSPLIESPDLLWEKIITFLRTIFAR